MEIPPFVDVFPIGKGGFPASYVSLPEGNGVLKCSKAFQKLPPSLPTHLRQIAGSPFWSGGATSTSHPQGHEVGDTTNQGEKLEICFFFYHVWPHMFLVHEEVLQGSLYTLSFVFFVVPSFLRFKYDFLEYQYQTLAVGGVLFVNPCHFN